MRAIFGGPACPSRACCGSIAGRWCPWSRSGDQFDCARRGCTAAVATRREQRHAGGGGAAGRGRSRGEFKQAEAVRDGKTQASADLETFYKQVLPGGCHRGLDRSRIVKPQQRARSTTSSTSGGQTEEEIDDDSGLERQTVAMTLSGRRTTSGRSSIRSRRRRTSS